MKCFFYVALQISIVSFYLPSLVFSFFWLVTKVPSLNITIINKIELFYYISAEVVLIINQRKITESKSDPDSLLLSESESIKGWFFRLPIVKVKV